MTLCPRCKERQGSVSVRYGPLLCSACHKTRGESPRGPTVEEEGIPSHFDSRFEYDTGKATRGAHPSYQGKRR